MDGGGEDPSEAVLMYKRGDMRWRSVSPRRVAFELPTMIALGWLFASTGCREPKEEAPPVAAPEPPPFDALQCPHGSEGCPCIDQTRCEATLDCVSQVCVTPRECDDGGPGCRCNGGNDCKIAEFCNDKGVCQPSTCPYVGDQECDEPSGTGTCAVGTDYADCCATPRDGICDESGRGGVCPEFSDHFDCGYCLPDYRGDFECDEPQGFDVCPTGTDPIDCCPTLRNGICEAISAGGSCPEDSDAFDCGFCPFEGDGYCDERQGFDICPEGTDVEDCCATPRDGVCEESGRGGECPDGTDIQDCDYCPWPDDGECDEPEGSDLCAEGTDPADCGS